MRNWKTSTENQDQDRSPHNDVYVPDCCYEEGERIECSGFEDDPIETVFDNEDFVMPFEPPSEEEFAAFKVMRPEIR